MQTYFKESHEESLDILVSFKFLLTDDTTFTRFNESFLMLMIFRYLYMTFSFMEKNERLTVIEKYSKISNIPLKCLLSIFSTLILLGTHPFHR